MKKVLPLVLLAFFFATFSHAAEQCFTVNELSAANHIIQEEGVYVIPHLEKYATDNTSICSSEAVKISIPKTVWSYIRLVSSMYSAEPYNVVVAIIAVMQANNPPELKPRKRSVRLLDV